MRLRRLPSLLRHMVAAHAALAHRPSGLLTDVDGTLSPIVPSPEQSEVPQQIKDSLAELARRLDVVAAVSGRSVNDLRQLVGLDQLVYVGNHGLEIWRDGQVQLDPGAAPFVPLVERAVVEAERRLRLPGVWVEPKGITASIHYRQAPEPETARQAILTTLEQIPEVRQLRITGGRMVVNLVPPLDRHKGTAVQALVRRFRLQGVLYMGDDTTDVDALAALRSLRGRGVAVLGVGVVSPESPPDLLEVSDYQVSGVEGVERLLQRLAEA